ncbi:uncharacterized protein K452DRAFT_286560 [Aplosporella prunicola CBS 121167]|uniref:Uncharacterized protein n=1 Tax=Aplosporella prunicola CBS 121167 TaxID=1176127 RepID=A0A6A6BH57_9PEZI|nr:uncharacterized protein K452DRAFT_286560 [Aplosporella prunicola CBS 121167]KAF2142928.1 hypothetical protein K452DRAFT_286560 [Aplosporella prunicola CBS 121167]
MPLIKRIKLDQNIRAMASGPKNTQGKRLRCEKPSSAGDSVDDMPPAKRLRSWKYPVLKPEGSVEDIGSFDKTSACGSLSSPSSMHTGELYGPLTDDDARKYFDEARDMITAFIDESRHLRGLHQRYVTQMTDMMNRVRVLEAENATMKIKVNDLEYFQNEEYYLSEDNDEDGDYQEGDA